ncbi:MAG: hypothetical protein AAF672_05005 [Pseudomonadota bacterium]
MRKLIIGLFAIMALGLAACTEETLSVASGGGGGKKTAQERKLEQDIRSLNQQTRDIITKNTIQGAAAGAALGCGVALIFGGNSNDCVRGAVAGGVVGGVAGNQVGRKAAKVNQELVKQRETIAKLSGINKRLGGIEANLRSVVRSQNAEIASLRRQVNAKQISPSQFNARVNAIKSNRQNIRNGLVKAENNVSQSQAELVKLERQGGKPLTQTKRAASSTKSRLTRLRKSVRLVSS